MEIDDGFLDLMLVMDLKATDSETLVRISNHLGSVCADIEAELERRQFVHKGYRGPPAKPAAD